MSTKNLEKHTAAALKAVQKGEPVPAAVFLPPAQRDTPNVVHAFTTELPNVQQNMARIQNEADPVGLLIAIATGMPVATHKLVKDEHGNWTVQTKYETLPLNSAIRERVIKHLADKVIPRLSVRATMGNGEEDPSKSKASAEWEATIGGAASRED